ncbi:hypothetical protein [Nostoc sp.]|uniref:hypothetical protein n=1 Tax=Nostoc sp. TaxID=1180 RepID=UPI002FF9C2E5
MTRLTIQEIQKLAIAQHLTLVVGDRSGDTSAKYGLYCGKGRQKEVLARSNTLSRIKEAIDMRRKVMECMAMVSREGREMREAADRLVHSSGQTLI